MYKTIGFLVLFVFIFGCVVEKPIYYENTTKIAALETALMNTQIELSNLQDTCITTCPEIPPCPECAVCGPDVNSDNCKPYFPVCAECPPVEACPICNITTIQISDDKYSFSCADVPTSYPYLNLTKARCYWQIRDHYKYGRFFELGEVCSSMIGGWIEACQCMHYLPEIYGASALQDADKALAQQYALGLR